MFKSYLSLFHTCFLSLCDKDVLFGFNLQMITPSPSYLLPLVLSPSHSLGSRGQGEDKTLNLTPQGHEEQPDCLMASRIMLGLPEIDV